LLNVPAPGTAGLNRFYTVEFYEEVKQILVPGGVISFPLAGSSNYLGGSTGTLYSVVVSSLKSVFKNVMIIPGQANYLLASDGVLTHEIAKRLQQKGIENEYVNFYYLDDQQIEHRGKQLLSQFEKAGQLNHDFNPVAYFATINYWLSWYGQNLRKVVWPVVLLILLVPFFLKKYTLGMYVAGFTATSLEMLVLLTFQVLFGNFYQSLALLIAAFMAGLAIGAFLPGWLKMTVTPRKFTLNQAIIGLTGLFLPAIILFQEKLEPADSLIMVLLYTLMVVSGALTAVHFAMSAVLQKNDVSTVASKIYSTDLLGSAGGLMVSVLIIPSLGLMNTGFLLGGINLVVAAFAFAKSG
jgi:spermidine synthase